MKKVIDVVSAYKSVHDASVKLGTSAPQMRNLIDGGALVDDNGQVWIKSKTIFTDYKKDSCDD